MWSDLEAALRGRLTPQSRLMRSKAFIFGSTLGLGGQQWTITATVIEPTTETPALMVSTAPVPPPLSYEAAATQTWPPPRV